MDIAIIGIILYGGAALLNANHLQRRAAQQPYGSSRDTAVALADGLRWVSHGIGLTAPGRWVDHLQGNAVRPAPGLAALAPNAGRSNAPTMAVATAQAPSVPITTAPTSTVAPRPRVVVATAGHEAGRPDGQGPSRALAEANGTIAGTTSASAVAIDGAATTGTGTSTSPNAASGAATTAASTAALTTSPAIPRLTLRNPTVDDPLRVYVGGDSLSQGVGTSLSRVASAFGTMKVLEHGVISSGLTRPDYYDWPAELSRALATGQPEAYVLMFGANDPQTIQTPDGNVNVGDPRWEEAYRGRVALVMGALSATRPLIWIGLPAVGRTDLEPQMQLLTRIYSQEAAKLPNVHYVDVRALTGPEYTPYLDDGNGKQVLVRAQDKVHFTPTGYDLLAKATADQLTALIRK